MPVIPRAPPVPEIEIFWNPGTIEYLGVLVEQQKNQDEDYEKSIRKLSLARCDPEIR